MTIGDLTIDRGILLAPMEDVSDPPFRLICKRYGADLVYTEFISSEGLIRDARKALKKLTMLDEERPVGIQIYGGDVGVMVEAAKIAEEAKPDLIDINCGCWVKNVVARNAGAGLLRDVPQMERMAKSVVDAVKLPVTLKTRLGWDAQSIKIVEVAQRMEAIGVRAIAIHCRTRVQGHAGDADWTWIPRVKEAVSIPVILNGDVRTPEDVARAFAETGADAVMIGRGAINNPWIFSQAKLLIAGASYTEPTPSERIATAIEHLKLDVTYKENERRAVLAFRKFWHGYLKGLYNVTVLRQLLMTIESVAGVENAAWAFVRQLDEQGQPARPESALEAA
jgi:tRNA-dihydrouridine synthase B